MYVRFLYLRHVAPSNVEYMHGVTYLDSKYNHLSQAVAQIHNSDFCSLSAAINVGHVKGFNHKQTPKIING